MKKAQIAAAIQRKGGSGKTTMVISLAGYMAKDGAKVLIIDTDPQQTCMDWGELTEIEGLDYYSCLNEDELIQVIEKYEKEYDLILIDTAGYDSRMATYAIQVADLILIPSGSALSNVNGAAQTFKHIQTLTRRVSDPPVLKIVLWSVKKGTNVLQAAIETFNKSNLSVVSSKIANLTGFEEITWRGGLPEGRSMQEIRTFVASLQTEGALDFYKELA